jgi:hypothetical protein
MASNASDFAVPSYSIEGIPEFSFSAELEETEKKESSSVRELLAILKTSDHMMELHSLKPLSWTTLWWLTDNANVEKMLAKGSGKLRITRLVLEILRKGPELHYDVHPIWVSRDNPFLQKADCCQRVLIPIIGVLTSQTFCSSANSLGRFPLISSPPAKTEKFFAFIHVPLRRGTMVPMPLHKDGTASAFTLHRQSPLSCIQ